MYQKICNKLLAWIEALRDKALEPKIVVRKEFSHVRFAQEALQKLLDEYEFNSVLDVGSGEGLHAEIFKAHRKEVTAIDFGEPIYAGFDCSQVSLIKLGNNISVIMKKKLS